MNNIDPTAIIGDNVILGDNNYIGAYTVIGGDYMHEREDKCFKNGKVIIGDNNTIAHHVIILSPFRTPKTTVGSFNNIYSQNFIGHDAKIGNYILMTAGCLLAGVITIEDYVNLGMGVRIHQRLIIGEGAMLGMGSVIVENVLPYEKVAGIPAKSLGLNEKTRINREINIMEVERLRKVFINRYK